MTTNKELSNSKTTKAIIYTVVGIFLLSVVLEPMAIFYANRALELDPNNNTAYNTRVVAIIVLCLYGFLFFCGFINGLLER